MIFLSCIFASGVVLSSLAPVEVAKVHSGMDQVDCIYVINLKKRAVKWEAMQKSLASQGLIGNRVNAVNGWKLSETIQKRILTPGFHLNGGQIGCFLSHLSVWKDAIERNWKCIWVMEDDLIFLQPVSSLIAILDELNEIDPYWDVLYTDPDYRCPLSGDFITKPVLCLDSSEVLIKDPVYYQTREILSENIVQIYGRWGTYSMVISKSGIQKLFQELAFHALFSPIDHQIHTRIPFLRQYATRVAIVTQDISSISDTNAS